jgi:hypothetical protein
VVQGIVVLPQLRGNLAFRLPLHRRYFLIFEMCFRAAIAHTMEGVASGGTICDLFPAGTPFLLVAYRLAHIHPAFCTVCAKRPERETDHSPPSADEMEWSYTSTTPYVFLAWRRISSVDINLFISFERFLLG